MEKLVAGAHDIFRGSVSSWANTVFLCTRSVWNVLLMSNQRKIEFQWMERRNDYFVFIYT